MRADIQRIKIIAMLDSSSSKLKKAADLLGKDLSTQFGGAFISHGQGFWSSQGNEFIDEYPATSINQQPCLRIELLVTPDKAETACRYLQARCRHYNQTLELGCEHMHLEQVLATAHHCIIT